MPGPVGAWRSLVAHLLWEQRVGGSNPSAPTKQIRVHSGDIGNRLFRCLVANARLRGRWSLLGDRLHGALSVAVELIPLVLGEADGHGPDV